MGIPVFSNFLNNSRYLPEDTFSTIAAL